MWKAEIDPERCSLCEICAELCPRHALSARRTNGRVEILFDPSRCDGCSGEPICEDKCPEKAVRISPAQLESEVVEELEAPVILFQAALAECVQCGKKFLPERKLGELVDGDHIVPRDIQHLCPACRRNRLMDSNFKPKAPR